MKLSVGKYLIDMAGRSFTPYRPEPLKNPNFPIDKCLSLCYSIKYQKETKENMKTILVLVMMMTLSSFGVTVTDKVLSAIAMKESGNRNGVKGDLHLKTPSVGVYQIRTDYLKDVLRVYGAEAKKTFGRPPTMEDMQYNPKMAKWVVSHYLQYYGRVYQKRTGKAPTAEIYFMIHNGGPNGYNKNKYPSLYACTSKYAKSAMKYYKT